MIDHLPIKKWIKSFISNNQCPFCKLDLVQVKWRPQDPLPKIICPKGHDPETTLDLKQGNYCPYFFEIISFANQEKSYNVIELSKCPGRVWIGNWTKRHEYSTIGLGEFQHIPCVLLPYKKADLSDMDKFIHRIKTIHTFG